MSTSEVTVVERDGSGVVVLRLHRPATLNAITESVFDALDRRFEEIANRSEDRVVVMTGDGRGFCSGLDLSLTEELASSDPKKILSRLDRWSRVTTRLREMDKPAIAAVNGPATGGGLALALACDVRIAAPEAQFSVAFIRAGFTGSDMGVSYLLPRVVGLGAASDLMLSGRVVAAEEAMRIGLINRVVPSDQLLTVAKTWSDSVVRNDPHAVALTKRALQTNIDAPSLGSALALENRNQTLMALSGSVQIALEEFRNRDR